MIHLPVDGLPTVVVDASVVDESVVGLSVGVEAVVSMGGGSGLDTEPNMACVDIKTKLLI